MLFESFDKKFLSLAVEGLYQRQILAIGLFADATHCPEGLIERLE